jgi:hypothetical protein
MEVILGKVNAASILSHKRVCVPVLAARLVDLEA